MSGNRLSPLQRRVLEALAGLEPPFVLTGGGALAGFYLGHRETRDLDLFFRELRRLERVVEAARARLREQGLIVEDLQAADTFHRFRVVDGAEVTMVDLVADIAPALEAPLSHMLGSTTLQVESRHEIFVNKLCTLLGRAELRDLLDLKTLLEAGEDLSLGLEHAPQKDGGFSPLTLAWVLRGFPIQAAAKVAGWSPQEAVDIAAFRDELVGRLVALSPPEPPAPPPP